MAYGMENNPNYKVRIAQQGGGKVEAYVPETFQLAVTSQFGQPFGQGISNSTVGTATKILGLTLAAPALHLGRPLTHSDVSVIGTGSTDQ